MIGWGGLLSGLPRKDKRADFSCHTTDSLGDLEGVASGPWAHFSDCKMGGAKGQSNTASFIRSSSERDVSRPGS